MAVMRGVIVLAICGKTACRAPLVCRDSTYAIAVGKMARSTPTTATHTQRAFLTVIGNHTHSDMAGVA